MIALLVSLLGCSGGSDDAARVGPLALQFEGAGTLDAGSNAAFTADPEVQAFLAATGTAEAAADTPDTPTAAASQPASLATVTPLPHTTQAPVSPAERRLLKAYLNNPGSPVLASFLAVLSLDRSLLAETGRDRPGAGLKHTLLAQYFLNRAQANGAGYPWLAPMLVLTQREIDRVLAQGQQVTANEDHEAHKFFNETFNYREGDRYTALDKLLEDYAAEPKNVYTTFLLDAVNLWIGGEAGYDDPTTLHNYVIGSFFSIQAMDLARKLEEAWNADPATATPRFRMASILGGFSVLQRRWLAKMHGDTDAVTALDEEHRQWRLIHRSFHAFTVGLAYFEEPENFLEGLYAWNDALPHCNEIPVRTCSNLPRLSHNFEGFVLGWADYLLKAGQTDAAKQLLAFRHIPDQVPPMAAYPDFTLGQGPWESREANADSIAALYANGDPADDPVHLMLQPKRWGQSTATCQLCHQAQKSVWTDDQKNTIVLPPEEVASVRVWPSVSTTWYGTALPNPPVKSAESH